MIFDECTPYPSTHSQAHESMQLTHKWAESSKKYFDKKIDLNKKKFDYSLLKEPFFLKN